MKLITKKILESGLVEKSTAELLQKWGMLSLDELMQLGQKRVMFETLEVFIQQLEELLESDLIFKETRLEILVKPPVEVWPITSLLKERFSASEDEMGRLIVAPLLERLAPGDVLYMRGKNYKILSVDVIYKNDVIAARQLAVELV